MFDSKHTPSRNGRPNADFEECLRVVLSNPRRKSLLSALARTEEKLTVSELAAMVSPIGERDGGSGGGTDRRTAASLYHCDVPKLADHGLVRWDREAREAELTGDGTACVEALGL